MALSLNPQTHSPLLCLPGELRNKIYAFALTSLDPITDPSTSSVIPSRHNSLPTLGVPLLRTCRRIYNEADARLLYACNRFRFTSVTYTHHFLSSLPPADSTQIQDLEIDVRDVHEQHPGISREWAQYLSWSTGVWAQKLGSLRADAPGVRVLRLNFEAWPRIAVSRRHLWDILRRLLLNVEGLERVVVVGRSRGEAMARIEPWSPVHYVGADDLGDEAGKIDLVERMWGTVGKEGNEKVVRWTRGEGVIELEVVLVSHIRRTNRSWVGTPIKKACQDPWPRNGSCSWLECQQRNVEASTVSGSRVISPNVA